MPVRFVHYPGTSDVMLAMARGEVHATTFGAQSAARFAEEDEEHMLFVWSKEPVEFIEDDLADLMVVAATETVTDGDIELYGSALAEVLA